MEGAYLPGNIRQRMQELMKEHKITQEEMAIHEFCDRMQIPFEKISSEDF